LRLADIDDVEPAGDERERGDRKLGEVLAVVAKVASFQSRIVCHAPSCRTCHQGQPVRLSQQRNEIEAGTDARRSDWLLTTTEEAMIDHMGFPVSDYARAKAVYEKALAPLGYVLVIEVDQTENDREAAGLCLRGKPD